MSSHFYDMLSVILEEGMKPTMDWEALIVALEFWRSSPDSNLVLQVHSALDKPYVKRVLQKHLGVASRVITDDIYYGKRCITIQVVESVNFSTLGHHPEDTFFIPNSDRKELTPSLEDLNFVPYTCWKECGHTLADINAMMIRDNEPGYAEAMSIVHRL